MYRISLPGLDAVLLLSPRWAAWSGALQALAMLLFLLPLLLTVGLYRYELRLVQRGVALLLLALRLTALGSVLLLVALQPVVERTHTEETPGRVLVCVDRSASMDVRDEPDGPTRAAQAQRLLTSEHGLLSALQIRHRVELLGFARECWDLPTTALGQPEPSGPATGATDLRAPLSRALEHSSADSGPLLGVIVITDGRHNAGASPLERADELKKAGIPIYPIPLGSGQAPPDIVVAELTAPRSTFKDDEINVEAQVKIAGIKAQLVRLELQQEKPRPGQESAWETLGVDSLRHDGTDRTYTVPFPIRLADLGTQTLRVTARPADERSLPRPLQHNRREVRVNVTDDQARVLLIDGEARWEFYYLSSALGRDRNLKLDRVLFEQPSLGRLSEAELKKLGHPARTLPTEPDALARFDCIILGDVAPEQLPVADRQRLEKFVADRGGTLLLLAGKRWLPLAYVDASPSTGETDPLLRLLPILKPHVIQTTAQRGLAVRLTPDGQLAAYLQMDANREQSVKTWAELPGHFWGIVGRPKPGAVALAELVDPEVVPDKTSGLDAEAVIARQNFGFGRVVYVGVDSTWRWRFRLGDGYHHRFWGQLIRWAASDKPLVAGNEHIRFGTAQPTYHQGQEVEVT
ncbi:MAG: VWA domain-containing protein, partial [Planctomycetia bacterium]|nr:VWA domain-containing protein [Planctomycetia bacterium]